jgi:hypothetical protein
VGTATRPAAARPVPLGRPDLARAFARVPAGVPVLRSRTTRRSFAPLQRYGPALTLSGHTHWGQLALAAAGWSLASPFQEFSMGAYVRGAALLYVHPGTGFWGIPFRLGATGSRGRDAARRAGGAEARLTVGEPRRAP